MSTAQEENAKLDRTLKAAQLVDAYKQTFGTSAGQTVLADIKAKFGTDRPAFEASAEGAFCSTRAAIKDGARSIVLHIDAQLSAEPTNQPAKAEVIK